MGKRAEGGERARQQPKRVGGCWRRRSNEWLSELGLEGGPQGEEK